ncbi:chitinase (class v) [Trichoderma cornu-damae]|uniref:chitinase n=1 Tax=Trichoderma cornu-damae TaxID=654480 RepID=A0A9P8QTJ3_9HYPO|nr:chitinase (class v) [Trichoderma cornu-damae]
MNKLLAFAVLICCLLQLSLQQEPQCSGSKLCPEGCCSSAGFCGYGPDYCGKGCQSTCDSKSECNPGWDSDEFSDKDSCPLNVCCSKHGFCGYTEDFCGNSTVKRPSCASDKEVTRVIGYFEAWAPSKRSCYSMMPEEIPYGQYTHIIFSFGTINPGTFKVSAGDAQTEYMMSRIGAIKVIQPDIKIWVALGGWAFNDPGPTQTTFSDIAASSANTNTFLDSLVQMMNKYGFDGVDIDWEYPVAEDRSGRPADFQNAVTFMKKLRERMKDSKRGVSMAIPASYWYLQNFDIKALESQVDWFNIMTYDVHGSWDIDNQWTGPWVNSHTNMTEIQQALDLLWRNDISPTKVTMGMSFYSRSFTLTDPGCSKLGCRVSSGGNAGKCSDTVGVLLHPEIQDIVAEKKLTPVLDRDGAVKTISWGNQWVSFDDVATWRLKGNIARGQCIEGFMVWAMSQDDSKATNIKALNQALGRKTPDFPTFDPNDKPVEAQPALAPKLCRWTSCFEGCPSGFKEVQRDGHPEIMLDTSICSDQFDNLGFARLCCPSSSPLPTCTWRGHRNSGNCQPGCEAGEVEVGSLTTGCKKNWQSACCTSTDVTKAYGECIWTGCTDDPEHICANKYIVYSPQGWGGHQSCKNGQSRALCCPNPPPTEFATDCKWVPKLGFLKGGGLDNICEGACPQDSVKLSLAIGFHLVPGRETACYGYNAFCCADPKPIESRDPSDDDSFGSTQAKEFKLLVAKYMENPTCPATIIEPTIHDQYGGSGGDGAMKRDLVRDAQRYEIIQARATDCTLANWERMLSYATLMFSVSQVGFDGVRSIWDNDFAGYFDEQYLYSTLSSFFSLFPWLDRRAWLEYILLNPHTAGEGMRNVRRADSAFCRLPSSAAKRELGGRSRGPERTRRTIWVMDSDRSDVPNIVTIFRGMANGDLSLHYARWQYARGTASGAAPGPFLELAYWIGPQAGVDTTDNPYFDQYRDMRQRNSEWGTDRWVVFHMHIDPEDPNWLWRHDGHTYMGIPGFRVFHAQEPRRLATGAWRVDSRQTGPYTARTGWECAEGDGYWYIGSPDVVEGEFLELMQEWGEWLYAEGYVSTLGLRLIVNPPGLENGDIDPSNPGDLVEPSGSSSAAGGLDPYELNWLVYGGAYNFFPAAPPP